MSIFQRIAQTLNIPVRSAEAVSQLAAEGGTIPFIARYRKDKTGGLDEVQITQILELEKELIAFDERKAFILKTISEQGKLTEDIQKQLDSATSLAQLEDIYLPFKPKRRTKAQIARENGLEPLAAEIRKQENNDIELFAQSFVNDNIKDTAAALQGARDIIAEEINEDSDIRAGLRQIFADKAQVIAQVVPGQEADAAKFKDYFDYKESVKTIPSHRTLAVMRGFMEGKLRMSIEPEEDVALDFLESQVIHSNGPCAEHLKKAVKDACRRLLQPSLETEFRNQLKTQADEEAIQVFAENLKQLLLSSPLGEKAVLAIDPGYRTGCKVVVLDKKGDLLHNDLIFVHEQNHKLKEAEQIITSLVHQYQIEAIAVGDGTAGRETESFIKSLNLGIPVFLVNEDGASVYSAGPIAREEFPDHDVTVRGAVSIGRRLMDPLAELVKIDPKSIGVGQYQHDVNQFRLKEKLDQTVVSCVNAVGVNVNTAGKHLLAYVSGIGTSLAEQIANYRKAHGAFKSRKELLEVPRLGAKAFEQCAGFLKIVNGTNPLDNSTVHPEAYELVERMAAHFGLNLHQLIGNQEVLDQIDPKQFVDDKFGIHTVNDIIKELKKPGLDPRSEIQSFEFANVYSIDDLIPGSILPGIVTNITRFGAFVDIGVKQDGLVHVSEIAHRFINDPSEALKLNQKVMVKVLEVDKLRNRISLSIKQATEPPAPKSAKKTEKKKAQPSQKNWFSALEHLKSKLN